MSEQTEQTMTEAIAAHLMDETRCGISRLHGIRIQILADITTARADGAIDRNEGRGIVYTSAADPITARALGHTATGDYRLRSYRAEQR